MGLCFPCASETPKQTSCVIQLLDNTDFRLPIRKTDSGSTILDKVCAHLDLYERDYFGLRFFNVSTKTPYWLDGQKNVLKQLKDHGVKDKKPKFYFGVKFYSPDPCRLKEELTRYLFFLQLRSDIASGRIPASQETQAELGALVAQAEFGDYNRQTHTAHYTDSLCLSENTISSELEEAIVRLHRSKVSGLKASQCEIRYLDLVSRQNLYGVQLYNVKSAHSDRDYQLGVSPHGLEQRDGKTKLAVFQWPLIDAINFKRRELSLTVRSAQDSEPAKHVFRCANTRACKQIWKTSLEHHTFFRLSKSTQPPSRPALFQFGSKHRYSGRTVKELNADETRKNPPQVRRNSLRSSQIRSGAPNASESTAAPPTPAERGNPLASHPGEITSDRVLPERVDETKSGLFTSGRTSPGSVKDIRLKFNSDASNDHRPKSRQRNGRSSVLGSDSESVISGRSHAHGSARLLHHHHHASGHRGHPTPATRAESSLLPSAERIISGYTRHNNTDRWQQGAPRAYENITYDEYGRPRIEPAPESIPHYQQNWLQNNWQRDYRHEQHSRTTGSLAQEAESATHGDYRDYADMASRPNHFYANKRHHHPNLYNRSQSPGPSYQRPGLHSKRSQLPTGFYEEKMMNRDSGTDSPTYYPTDEAGYRQFNSHHYHQQAQGYPHNDSVFI